MNFKEKSVMFLATGCHTGNIPFIPGTIGSIAGLPLCLLISRINQSVAFGFTLIFISLAVWIAHDAEKILKKKDPDCNDPGCIVIDEIAGIIIALFGLPFNLISVAAGFVLFRILDIWKPFPIRLLEKSLPGGLGIVMDDVAAGIASNLILRIVFILTG